MKPLATLATATLAIPRRNFRNMEILRCYDA
jgi:hypothetical protein